MSVILPVLSSPTHWLHPDYFHLCLIVLLSSIGCLITICFPSFSPQVVSSPALFDVCASQSIPVLFLFLRCWTYLCFLVFSLDWVCFVWSGQPPLSYFVLTCLFSKLFKLLIAYLTNPSAFLGSLNHDVCGIYQAVFGSNKRWVALWEYYLSLTYKNVSLPLTQVSQLYGSVIINC